MLAQFQMFAPCAVNLFQQDNYVSIFLYKVIAVLIKVVSKGKTNICYFSVHHTMLSSK